MATGRSRRNPVPKAAIVTSGYATAAGAVGAIGVVECPILVTPATIRNQSTTATTASNAIKRPERVVGSDSVVTSRR
jgi:hypothetical protein